VKVLLSFIGGMVACSLLIFTVRFVLPVQAASDNSGSASENISSNGLSKLLPDIERIYNESLTMPFKQAEKKIYDKDIAEYYRALMDRTGLVPGEQK
jgi:hypothetical protein